MSVPDRRRPRRSVAGSIPDATVARLPLYLRALQGLPGNDRTTVSSDALAEAAGVNSAKVRKDLSQLGSYGTRGVGYDVEYLMFQISRELGLTRRRAVAIVGMGNLGQALANYAGFAGRGFHVAVLADCDPARVGQQIAGIPVSDVRLLPQVARAEQVSIGVIATPAQAAQSVCDRLLDAGVCSILNFAPALVAVPDGVDVRKVDFSLELQILAFHSHRRAAGPERNPAGWTSALRGEATAR